MTLKKKRKRHILGRKSVYIIITVVLVLSLTAYSFLYTNSSGHNSSMSKPQSSSRKAAIVDQLSIFQPNKTFIYEATSILKEAGFTVDYYKGEEVTVDFYRKLPEQDYSLIILRAHSCLEYAGNQTTGNVDIFTSEAYSEDKAATTYFTEAWDDRLVRVFFTEGGTDYFGISPNFVKHSLKKRFNNTMIIMMGCDGLRPGYTTMAKAFIRSGAGVYIGWSGLVTSTYSDRATIYLLQSLTNENQTIKDAIISTMNKVGSDPAFQSELLCYP